MGISVKLWVADEIGNSPLLDVFVLRINSIIFELLFGVSHVSILLKLNIISPGVSQLLEFVVRVNIVEYWELWTEEEWEMSGLNESNVESNKELMMPDHCSEPIIVFPSSKSGDRVDWSNVKEHEQKSSSWSWEWFVMWWNLFWSNSLEKLLHVVCVRKEDWRSITMIWMNITYFHGSKSFGIIETLWVFSFVLNNRDLWWYLGLEFHFLGISILELSMEVGCNRHTSSSVSHDTSLHQASKLLIH